MKVRILKKSFIGRYIYYASSRLLLDTTSAVILNTPLLFIPRIPGTWIHPHLEADIILDTCLYWIPLLHTIAYAILIPLITHYLIILLLLISLRLLLTIWLVSLSFVVPVSSLLHAYTYWLIGYHIKSLSLPWLLLLLFLLSFVILFSSSLSGNV